MSAVRTYRGFVENGQIRLDADVRLPEKAHVFVVVPDAVSERLPQICSPRLVDRTQAAEFAKQVVEFEEDA